MLNFDIDPSHLRAPDLLGTGKSACPTCDVYILGDVGLSDEIDLVVGRTFPGRWRPAQEHGFVSLSSFNRSLLN